MSVLRQRRVRPAGARRSPAPRHAARAPGGPRAAVRLGDYGDQRAPTSSPAASASGWPGPRARQPAAGAAARRAARGARPQAARADAGRAQGHPARRRHHLPVRHPRPGGGAHADRPDRRVQRGPHRAGRHRRARSTSSRRAAFVAGFVGTSNLLHGRRPPERCWGATASFGIRPEKIHLDGAGGTEPRTVPCGHRAPSPRSSTRGRSPATSSTSTPGGGSSSCEQNGSTAARPTSAVARWRRSSLLWAARHVIEIAVAQLKTPRHEPRHPRGDTRAHHRTTCRHGAVFAVAAAGSSTACGSSTAAAAPRQRDRRRRLPGPDLKPLPRSARRGQGRRPGRPGYVEDGSNDPTVDWVTRFEEETGCKVTVKTFGTSDEAVQPDEDRPVRRGVGLRRRLAAPRRRRRRRAGQDRPGARTTPDIFEVLKNEAVEHGQRRQMYGVPHGRGANLLMYNTDVVSPAPDSLERGVRRRPRRTRARSPPTTRRSTSPTRRCT